MAAQNYALFAFACRDESQIFPGSIDIRSYSFGARRRKVQRRITHGLKQSRAGGRG